MKSLNGKSIRVNYTKRYTYSFSDKTDIQFKYFLFIDDNKNIYFIISLYDEKKNDYMPSYCVDDIVDAALGDEVCKNKISNSYNIINDKLDGLSLYNDKFIQLIYRDTKNSFLRDYNEHLVRNGKEEITIDDLPKTMKTMFNLTDDELECIVRNSHSYEDIIDKEENPECLYNYYLTYWNKKEYEKVVEVLKKAEKYNHIKCIFHLAFCYSNGIGIRKNKQEAFKRYKIAADHDIVAAIYNLGLYYYYGRDGIVDYYKAFEYFKRASEMGHKLSVPKLAIMYYEGLGTEVNIDEALKWTLKGVEYGNDYCMYLAGHIYEKIGEYEKSVYFLEKACEANYPDAYSILGYLYLHGEGVSKDIKKAIELFNKAVENGVSTSYFNLGMQYLTGEGVLKDTKKGFELIEKGAKKRDIRAQVQLAHCYEYGIGCSTDLKKARDWYYRAIVNGNTEAQPLLDNLILKIKDKNSKTLDALYYGFNPANVNPINIYKKHIEEKLKDLLNDETVKDDEELYLDSDNPEDKYALALLLFRKEALKQKDRIIELLKSASEDNYSKAILALGAFYFLYCGVSYNESKAEGLKCFERAAKLNNSDAQYLYAYCCTNGIGCAVNKNEGLLYFYLAAKYNHEDAMVYIYSLPSHEKNDAEKLYEAYIDEMVLKNGTIQEIMKIAEKCIANNNYSQAVKYLNKCTNENNAYAYYLYALCSEKNMAHKEALLSLVKSAKLGYNIAQYELGYYLLNKMCTPTRSVSINPSDFVPETAEYWLHLAANSKYIPAITEYSKVLEKKSISQAIEFMLSCEDLKDGTIYHTLGTLYSKNRDYQNAFKYLTLAINYGITDANFDLALLYLYGNGVSKDVNKAINYFVISSYLVSSCTYLINIYEKEEGFIDYSKAYSYCELAKRNSKYPIAHIDEKIRNYNNNKCPVCGSYFSKITKKTLFGTKTICSKCKNNL